MKRIKLSLLVILPILSLSSCGTNITSVQNTQPNGIPQPLPTHEEETTQTVITKGEVITPSGSGETSIETGVTVTETGSNNSDLPPVSMPTTISQSGANKNPKALQGVNIESVKNMNTIDDLKAINPNIANVPGSDRPGFAEFQKNQILLGYYISEIKDTDYQRLQRQRQYIYEARDIWPADLQAADTALSEVTTSQTNMNTGSVDMQKLIQAKNEAMGKFHASQEYQDYIVKNQDKLTELGNTIKKYWTPEMIALQKEIDIFNAKTNQIKK